MKLITAVIKPHKLEDVRSALETFGVSGIPSRRQADTAGQKGHTEVYRGAEYDIALIPKVRLEIVVDDGDVDDVVGVVCQGPQTGTHRRRQGLGAAGRESVVRVRTGDPTRPRRLRLA